ncbi:YugN family protein [Sporosarcina cyprini]|uniref:YugN family protein n=1 Tax=Sporosarcina cyprini TaxID=2910523 RepID=UPI001EE0608D|nr:YugN family protein [Sporosarcina cyprini]MCG3088979.1 YugN-like family protein [Sporosarcina cyprini]
MIFLTETELEGKQAYYGEICDHFADQGLILGNWDYDQGLFDKILYKRGGVTIYLRCPFDVIRGELDQQDALLLFKKPFIIKHILNIGLDEEESPVLTVTGLEQFQKPVDKDAPIEKKSSWAEDAEQVINKTLSGMAFVPI